jgi:16S rRNA (uracil1498-N3)-methyltransferase
MARERRRLLIAPERLAAAAAEGLELPVLALTAEESRYLTRVLRYGPGDGFAVINGAGSLWSAELLAADRAVLQQPLAAPLQDQPPSQPQLVLAAAVVKRDFEVVVRMAVELGVDRLIPLLCERTAVQGQLRPERWRTIAAEAAEQCERLWMPQIDQPTPLAALLAEASAPGAAACLRCWATTRRDGLMPLDQLLQLEAWASTPDAAAPLPTGIWLACGPEGGWSEAEEQQVLGLDWQPVGLGPRILRSSTACIAGLSSLSAWRAARSGC